MADHRGVGGGLLGELSRDTTTTTGTTSSSTITEAFAYLEILSAYLGVVQWESQVLACEAGNRRSVGAGPPVWRLPCVGGSGWEEVLCAQRRCRHPACYSRQGAGV